jgi:prevent-host-death family protein
MRTTTLTDAKKNLSVLIDQVRAGETVMILDRGRPVARIEPVGPYADPSGRLARLARAGVIHVGSAAPPIDLLRRPAPPVSDGASAAQSVLDERRSGRS